MFAFLFFYLLSSLHSEYEFIIQHIIRNSGMNLSCVCKILHIYFWYVCCFGRRRHRHRHRHRYRHRHRHRHFGIWLIMGAHVGHKNTQLTIL